ncbi:hypothetical protein M427DRAFT_415478 [Gonapodya prolifera JEL478]|uniref:TRF2-interacting telomeric protein/Rap1 C-terminal domain-containing protein n=1 Tax=Gonapodya prolifera (strain JEL478) TaxID=1344416 RepID=A0A139A4X9_GONPJ|nr:hypothetical protein M427DRAFT_415478 [Gonapodya prolifera JEL478]|eukprot:KXS11872.1 hypothetical protein M427DRAFT_415478 [Gonapodya prolifera JEL478]
MAQGVLNSHGASTQKSISQRSPESHSSGTVAPPVASGSLQRRPKLGTGKAPAPHMATSEPPLGNGFTSNQGVLELPDEPSAEQLALEARLLAKGKARAARKTAQSVAGRSISISGTDGQDMFPDPTVSQPKGQQTMVPRRSALKGSRVAPRDVESEKLDPDVAQWEEKFNELVATYELAPVREAIYMTMANLDVARALLEVGSNNLEDLPNEIRRLVWTEQDDATLRGSNTEAINALTEERGPIKIKKRIQWIFSQEK